MGNVLTMACKHGITSIGYTWVHQNTTSFHNLYCPTTCSNVGIKMKKHSCKTSFSIIFQKRSMKRDKAFFF